MLEIIGKNYIYYLFALLLAIVEAKITLIAIDAFLSEKSNSKKLTIENGKRERKERLNQKLNFKLCFDKYLKTNIIHFVILATIYIFLFISLLMVYDNKYSLNGFVSQIQLLSRLIIFPILTTILVVDYKQRIIPNRLILLLFEIGILTNLVIGFYGNIYIKESFIGFIVGAILFGILTILSKLVLGKDSIGVGDIKLILVVGLMFGIIKMLDITLLAFFFGFIVIFAITISRKLRRIKDEFVSFGPFLVLSIIIAMYLEAGTIIKLFEKLFIK